MKKKIVLRTAALLTASLLFTPLFFLSSPFLIQSDEDCMVCHEDPELKTDDENSQSSIHGEAGFSCVDCHSDLRETEEFPHPDKLKAVNCSECHDEAAREYQTGIHIHANPEEDCCAVTCADCHGKHDIKSTTDISSRVYPLNLPQTCESCHLERVKTKRGGEFIKQYEMQD